MLKSPASFLFLIATFFYLSTHIINLENYPIYFFSDEAIQAVKAEQLIKNGFKDENKFLPVLMRRFDHYNLGITVYLNMLGMLLFGKHIWVVRGTTVIFTLLGSIAVSLLLKQVFKVKNYWVGLLYLSVIPMFFIHSRTGFEAPIGTSFYSLFLYFYFLYRTKKTACLIPAIIFAVLSFYSVPGMWLTIISSLILFFIVDIPFHGKHFKVFGFSVVLTVILFLPLVKLYIQDTEIFKKELQVYNSYLVKQIPLTEKIQQGLTNYIKVINPGFLFFYSDKYLENYGSRHVLKGYGQFPTWSLPLVLLGLLYVIRYLKEKPLKRLVIITLITAPLGSLVNGFSATRNMQMVITMTILFALGVKTLEVFIDNTSNRQITSKIFSAGLFISMSFLLLSTTYDSLINGPTWFQDYGLYGMQYGAKQLFTEIDRSLDNYNYAVASTDFANAEDVFIPFFISKEKLKFVKLRSIRDFIKEKLPVENTILFAIPEEYADLKSSGLFEKIYVKKILSAPNGKPAFYKLEMRYRENSFSTVPIETILSP